MSKSLLSVNGHKAMNFLLQTIFEKEYQFLPATDAYQALHLLKANNQIEALIIDVDFQPQQNWELIQHIKTSRLYRVPVIILATENSDDVKQKCLELEIDEIFFKPFNPMDLISAIKSMTATILANA